MAALAIAASVLGVHHNAQAQEADESRIVSPIRVTVRFDSGSYVLDESAGTAVGEISLIARTRARTVPPLRGFRVAVVTRDGTAESPDDYQSISRRVRFGGRWAAVGNAYESRVRVPVRIAQDDLVEGDEKFRLLLQLVGREPTVAVVPADLTAPRCTADGCASSVTIVDDDSRDADEPRSGEVTIAARHGTALQGIDPLEFVVTRSEAADQPLDVGVTLSSGIIDADRLSHTVTIGANETSAELRVPTRTLDPAAATGDVIATVDDGEQHDVPDPPTASVRVYVGDPLVTVRLNAGSYTVGEAVGATGGLIRLVARTEPGIPAPVGSFVAALSTRGGTAASPSDYGVLSQHVVFEGEPGGAWVAVDGAYQSEVAVPLTVADDDAVEGDETLRLLLERTPGLPATVGLGPADLSTPTCMDADDCAAIVTITDNDGQGVTVHQTSTLSVDEGATSAYTVVLDTEPTDDVTVTPQVQDARDAEISVSQALTFTMDDWHIPQTMTVTAAADDNRAHGSATISHGVAGGDYEAKGVTAPSVEVAEVDAEGRTVVSLVRVPDGTVIPDNSTVSEGATVLDGSTFEEGERAWFRILLSAADGGPAPGGADVELSFWWHNTSPLVTTSGQISKAVFSLPRAGVWDTVVQIAENTVGNPDGTLTVRITGCERNGCVIGERSEITVTIADDDGGPEAAHPGRPQRPAVLCPDRGHSSFDTGLKVIWEAPDFVGGAPTEYYEVRYRSWNDGDGGTAGWGEWQLWPHGSAATSTTIVGLEPDTAYGVQVRAVNANGPGEWSLERTQETGQPDHICDILDELDGG